MENNKKIGDIAEVLNQIIHDSSIPRNIRNSTEEAKKTLMDEKEDLGMKVSSVQYLLDEISNDRNLPMHARTIIWNIASDLETIRF
jgi:uncharacterized protein (UPF0147 family)|tara:strand:- start:399 stop:656 length:258 start_codon:yes stop_codon:yes gene_type:complete